MGSRPSRAKANKVQAVEAGAVVVPPAQKQTASAPPTPLHPEGTPRTASPFEEFPGPPGQILSPQRSQTMTDAWMPGPCSAVSASSSLRDKAVVDQALEGYPTAVLPQVEGYTAAAPNEVAAASRVPTAPGQASDASSPSQPVIDTALPATSRPVTGGENHLDVPLEEILKQATEAFGASIATSLSSTKWDRRVESLKGVTTILKGLDIKVGTPVHGSHVGDGNGGAARGLQLRDHARCFNAACLILHIVMKDKVLPVLQAAHELYRVTFEHGRAAVTEAEALSSATILFPHIIAKLGDLNIRLHDSACACILFTAAQPFFGISLTLRRLKDLLEGRGSQHAAKLPAQQKMRVNFGVMQAVEMLIKQSPGRRADEGDLGDAATTWTPADISPFIVTGLQADSVTGARVQQVALALAMNIYMTLGKAPLFSIAEQLTPAAKVILVARLEEEGEDLDEMDGADGDEDCVELSGDMGLCVMGVGLRAPAHLAIAKPNTTDGEECLMDEILEDTGLVMGGQDLIKKQAPRTALDEELLGLGLASLDEAERELGRINEKRLRSKDILS